MALGGTNFKLRSSTGNDPYASIEFTAAVIYTAGQMVLHNDIVGVVVDTVAVGDQVVIVYQAARITVPCAIVTSGNLADYDEGSKVYFDAADAEVNTTAAGNTLCGIVVETPASGVELVDIHLMGALSIVA